LLLAALVVVVVSAGIGLFGSLAAGVALGETQRTDQWLHASFFSDALAMSFRAFVGIAFWTLVAAAVTVITRSLAAGIGITVAALFVGDFATMLIARLGTLGEWVSRAIPNTAINA